MKTRILRDFSTLPIFAVIMLTIIISLPSVSQALTEEQIKVATHIVNLEATPVWFRAGRPIDFVVTIKYDGGTQDGFDVGVLHESRLVGVFRNVRLGSGMNTFTLRDPNFTGDPGNYIVQMKFNGNVFTQKVFATRRHQIPAYVFTLDPKVNPPEKFEW